MATDQLVELLTLDSEENIGDSSNYRREIRTKKKEKLRVAQSNVNEELDLAELWEHTDYDSAFDVSAFLSDLT